MMTESQALETLTREDPEAADDARAALAWLTGDEGLETISLLRLQEFLWYALPVKWPMSTPGRVGVAKALGRLFLLAGMDRYAAVCSSAGTEKHHHRVRRRARGGHRRLHRGHRGVERGPAGHRPARLGLGHGPAGARRLRRLRRRPGTGLRLRRAVRGGARLAHPADGDRQPLADRPAAEAGDGARASDGLLAADAEAGSALERWTLRGRRRRAGCRGTGRRRRAGPTAGCDGSPGTDTWLGRISAERIDAWAHGRPGERSRLARTLIPRLLEPPAVPDDPLPTLRWLLGHAGEGLRLTARHYIAPALVTEAVEEFGWRDQLVGTLRQELDVFPLHTLRGMAQSRDGGHPAQPHQPGADQDRQADDGRPRCPLAHRHRRADRPGRRPPAGLLGRGARGRADGHPDQRADRLRRADQAADRPARRGGLGRRGAGACRPAPDGTGPGCTAPGWPAPSAPSSTRSGTGCGRCTCSAPSAASARRYR